MKLPDFDQIDNQQLMDIRFYPYKGLDTYLKTSKDDSRYHWHRSNLLGEMYENLIYEKLKHWANDIDEVSEFILKGPHICRNHKTKEGLVYDSKNQIFYMSAGETIGEFDALFKYGECRYFVEIKNTNNKPIIRKMKYEILRKYNLLRILFPKDNIGCWIITTYKDSIKISNLPNVTVTRTPKYELDPKILENAENDKFQLSPPTDKYITAYQLDYHPFHYFGTLKYIHKRMLNTDPRNIKGKLIGLISPYIGLIERVFLGKMSVPNFNSFLKKHDYKHLDENMGITDVYFAYKIKESLSPVKTIYLRGKRRRYYEITDLKDLKTKIIGRTKRSTKDISRLDRSLKQLNIKQVEQF